MNIELEISKKIFNDVYIPFLNDDTRTQLLFGGSSSGKSYFLAQRDVLDVLKGGRNFLLVRNVKDTIRKSIYNEIVKAISFFKVNKYFTINKSDMVITCVNGYQILFGGLDDVEKIKSITPQKGVITDIRIEEATETDRDAVKQLYKRLRGISKDKKRLTMSFNPILQDHWIYKDFFGIWDNSKQCCHGDDIVILKTTYKDNRFLTPDDIKGLEEEPDPYYYDVYTLGNWGVLGAVIFKNWRSENCSEIRKIANKFKNGLDFGYGSDPAALIHTYYDKMRKRIYVLDEMYEKELTNDVLADKVKAIIGRQIVTCDSSEPKSIQELKNLSITAKGAIKGKDSVNFGIQWLQRQEIIIDISCQNTKNEFQQYKWREDKNGNVLNEPVDKLNHLIDGLRYAYEDEMKSNKKAIKMDLSGKRESYWKIS
jgi:phage terminase large subunit